MTKKAFIFPGQGSQVVGMGKDIYFEHPLARRILDQADDVLGMDLTGLCFNGPQEELNLTVNTQPALLAVSYALFKLLEAEGIEPALVAGHSLGEYSALLAAGGLAYEDALKLVHERAVLMQNACSPGVGAMAALVGLDRDAVFEVCREAGSEGIVEAVNFNCPGQIVVAGQKQAVRKAMEIAKSKGVKLAVELAVSAPSHCSLMSGAGVKLADYLTALNVRELQVPLVTNVEAAVVKDADIIKSALVKQLSSPVYWEDSINTMLEQGIDVFVEVGPGMVLTRLLKRINRKVASHAIGNVAGLKKISALL